MEIACIGQHSPSIVRSLQQTLALAADQDDHLVELPLAAWRRSLAAQVGCALQPQPRDPSPDRLVRNIQAAFAQVFLDGAVAEREAQIKPDSVADDVGREAVASVEIGAIPPPYRRRQQPSAFP